MGKSKQFRWTKPLEDMLLEILAEEVRKGNKPSRIFKPCSYARVVKAIKEKFNVECDASNVENHLRTVKSTWTTITTILGNSGFEWDDNLKMITAEKKVYEDYITAHPKHERFIYRKLDMYHEMALVGGKDIAARSFAKSSADIDLEDKNGTDSVPVNLENAVQEVRGKQTCSSISSSKPRLHCKRNHDEVDEVEKLYQTSCYKVSEALGRIASAINKFSEHKVDLEELYEQVMKMEGFDEISLLSVVDYFVEHEKLAKAFMIKSENHRRIWLHNFLSRRDAN